MTPTELFQENKLLVYWTLYRLFPMVSPRDQDWEDYVSEARLGLWKAAVNYNPESGCAFSTFAVNLIYRQVFDYRKRRQLETVSLDGDPIPYKFSLSVEQEVLYREMMRLMQEDTITSMRFDGFSCSEVARLLNVSQSIVSRRTRNVLGKVFQLESPKTIKRGRPKYMEAIK